MSSKKEENGSVKISSEKKLNIPIVIGTSKSESKPMSTTTKIIIIAVLVIILIAIGVGAYFSFKTKMAEVKIASTGVDDLSKFGENWLKAAYPKKN